MLKQKPTLLTTVVKTSRFQHHGQRKDAYVTAEPRCLHDPPPASEIERIGRSTVGSVEFDQSESDRQYWLKSYFVHGFAIFFFSL